MKILLTGAAGFIASHVLPKLKDHEVHRIDAFVGQVHGLSSPFEAICCSEVIFAEKYDCVIHLAALVGVGQSMYQPSRYIAFNTADTAAMLENLTKNKPKRLVVASSMSVYGEGERNSWYRNPGESFQMHESGPTKETNPPDLRSIYALTKYDQEQLCLMWGKANGVEVVALRFFNVYGPGQALSNPYTGVLTIFANRLLHSKAPIIFEDGQQTRDFINVSDVADAVIHAALNEIPSGVYNVGTGIPRTIESVALDLARVMSADMPPVITGKVRAGDIRHCYADNNKLVATGWKPKVKWEDGLRAYVDWLKTQELPEDRSEQAVKELEERGLLK